jgi:hypothetical protein
VTSARAISDGLGAVYAAWRVQPPWRTARALTGQQPKVLRKKTEDDE